ncbi:ATP-binding cassette transporter-like protein [Saccharata proteae CBS 121410]|uniref:ATP-binding cassette transporter-like protein n=1 Tax=Saccharata proteae CBS 121410 TaxID=1314787 RepID=A0A9P4I0W4_9PEZI|nr:ATP-binding cassette transporter-like protein [Saccharata proteae CBS 121410]
MFSSRSSGNDDVELQRGLHHHLSNNTVRSFSWRDVKVTVPDRHTKQKKDLLCNSNGFVRAGELLALMGPSGSGKTTLLNCLAHRQASSKASTVGSISVNGTTTSRKELRKLSSYVEQEDSLLGALTVKETLAFAAKLSLSSSIGKKERMVRITNLIDAFGLQNQADTLVGTPIRKGISGGQKRRLSVASQLVTSPKILFLDEPTSGLDSAASFEVINFVRNIAKKSNIVVIASIHQPSSATFELFDKLLLLSQGQTVYNGPVAQVREYFDALGFPTPLYTNPAEHILELINTDFSSDRIKAAGRLDNLQTTWKTCANASALTQEITAESSHANEKRLSSPTSDPSTPTANPLLIPLTLTHRSFIKSYRDVIAYGIRIFMYLGLAILMGTVWLRLSPTQTNIQAYTNAIFFGGAFMSFMAVAYIPSFLEDLSLFLKERANGLYGPTSFMLANFVVGVPYLFLITVLFSLVAYWLGNFQPTATAFWTWVMWLFLDLLAAESLVVLLSSIMPVFVVALAATAFANGLWMSVGGFMVAPNNLNVFWRYVFHYIDYQSYVFQGMMVNEFGERTYGCGEGCQCMYEPVEEGACRINGKRVLEGYGYRTDRMGEWVGILVAIIVVYRLLGLMALYMRRR